MRTCQNLIIARPVTLLLIISVLCFSFKMDGTGQVKLPAGTAIPMEIINTLRADGVVLGRTVDFRVTQDIEAEGKTVIEAGTVARGQVVRSQRAKGVGEPAFIEVQVKSVKAVDGTEIYLAGGRMYEEGKDRKTEAILLGIFICLLLLTIKGGDAQIPAGYSTTASVATTVSIDVN